MTINCLRIWFNSNWLNLLFDFVIIGDVIFQKQKWQWNILFRVTFLKFNPYVSQYFFVFHIWIDFIVWFHVVSIFDWEHRSNVNPFSIKSAIFDYLIHPEVFFLIFTFCNFIELDYCRYCLIYEIISISIVSRPRQQILMKCLLNSQKRRNMEKIVFNKTTCCK